MSYANVIMYSATLPSYGNKDKKGKKNKPTNGETVKGLQGLIGRMQTLK